MGQTAAGLKLPGLRHDEREAIERAERLGHGIVAEHATAVDRGTLSARASLEAVIMEGLAGIKVPRAYGGGEVGRPAELRVLEALAYGDGVTPFVIAQHYGTSLMLAASSNEALRHAMLPRMATGEMLTGFGISHLRRAGKPVLAATPRDGGYRFDGAIPWMTGYGLFDYVVIAGTLPDGQALSAWVALRETAHLRFNPPMELVAIGASQTVSATVEGLVVGADEIVAIGPNALRGRPNAPTVPCLFGLTRACIDDLAALAQRRDAPVSARAAERLAARLQDQWWPFYELMAGRHEGEEVVALAGARAAATQLAFDAIGALIVASGGSANSLAHPAQRRLREASVFATWGLSAEAIDLAVPALADGA